MSVPWQSASTRCGDSAGGSVKVRPAALKNEEAQEARNQHADNGAGEALSRYGVTVLHAYYYYDVTSSLST